MPRILIQFHADPAETIEFARCLRNEFSFSLAAISFSPFAFVLASKDEKFDFGPLLNANGIYKSFRLMLSPNEAMKPATLPIRLLDSNPGCVVIDIGGLSGAGLEESALSFMSDDPQAHDFAKVVSSRLKKWTRTGTVAVNPVTKAEARDRNHRHSIGAETLYKSGTKMLSIGGGVLLRFDENDRPQENRK